MLVAVLVSNLPEAIAAPSSLESSGWSRMRITGMWAAIAVISDFLGRRIRAARWCIGRDPRLCPHIRRGAILTMLATTMMPEAFEHAGMGRPGDGAWVCRRLWHRLDRRVTALPGPRVGNVRPVAVTQTIDELEAALAGTQITGWDIVWAVVALIVAVILSRLACGLMARLLRNVDGLSLDASN